MRIQSVNCNYGCKNVNQQQPAFNGFFMQIGTGHRTLTPNYSYSSVAYIPFHNGNTKVAQKLYKSTRDLKEKPIWVFPECEITADEGKSAFEFLFGKVQDSKAYSAVKKLKTFIESISFKDEHNVIYIEKEDSGIPKKENWSELKLSDITSKLKNYEMTHGISQGDVSEKPAVQKTYTIEELWEMIHRNGVA